MAKSDFPSVVAVSNTNKKRTVFEFLCSRFHKIPQSVWQRRLESGSVLYEDGNPAGMQDIAETGIKIFYYKEVEKETIIPFKEKILYADEHILVADKPHFLPVIPAGKYVNETLLNRLKKSTGIDDIVPVNRLDRETAGVVLFSINKDSRDAYYSLFRERLVNKSYKAISVKNTSVNGNKWRIENRLVQGDPWFRMRCSDGEINAVSNINLDKCDTSLCWFTLHPETGQKHQLRVHMALLGNPILNDRFYPVLFPDESDDFSKPLKLLADKISFKDPLTGKLHEFRTEQHL
ncbi:MAG: pseudouridine synthase [Spirochaetes bacterium]|nr:pseudouridine synthase [Spirochaetota bacterium]